MTLFPRGSPACTVPLGSTFWVTKATYEYTLKGTGGRIVLLCVYLQGFESPQLHPFFVGITGDFLRLFPKTETLFPSPHRGWEFCLPEVLLLRAFWGNMGNMANSEDPSQFKSRPYMPPCCKRMERARRIDTTNMLIDGNFPPMHQYVSALEDAHRDLLAIVEDVWDEGFSACSEEYRKQREDPTYPIHRTNPYKGGDS